MYRTKNKYWTEGDTLFIECRSKQKGIHMFDKDDMDKLLAYTWRDNGNGYLSTTIRANDKRTSMYAHRLVMNFPNGLQVDHMDGNRTNSRKCNLRAVTNSQNQQNQRKAKGYERRNDNRAKPYRAHIRVNDMQYHIGYYATAHEAHEAYLEAKKIYHPTSPMIRKHTT